VVRHDPRGRLQAGPPAASLEPREGEHFGIGKSGLIVGGVPPLRERARSGQKVIHQDVPFGQVRLEAGQRSRSSTERVMARNLTLNCSLGTTLTFLTHRAAS
jgi:hypothetical protein